MHIVRFYTSDILFSLFNLILCMANMSFPLLVVYVVVLVLVQSICGAHLEDNRVIIGSSVGGVLGLVSDTRKGVNPHSSIHVLDHLDS